MIDEAGLEKAAAVGDDLMAGSECVPLDVWREGIEAYQAHLASQAKAESEPSCSTDTKIASEPNKMIAPTWVSEPGPKREPKHQSEPELARAPIK